MKLYLDHPIQFFSKYFQSLQYFYKIQRDSGYKYVDPKKFEFFCFV